MSNDRHRHQRPPTDVHGRYEAGQTEYEPWYGPSRVGFGTKKPTPAWRRGSESLTQVLAAAHSSVDAIDGEGRGQGTSDWL